MSKIIDKAKMQVSRRQSAASSLSEAYAQAIAQGNTTAAAAVVDQAAAQGMSAARIYLDVFLAGQIYVGRLWHSGEINVAQEHLATQITLSQMDRLRQITQPRPANGLKAIVTTPEGDHHFMGARMVADFLLFDGWSVDFLGASTPLKDLVAFCERTKPNLVCISAMMPSDVPNVRKAIASLKKLSHQPKVMLGGNAFQSVSVSSIGADIISQDPIEGIREARKLLGLTTADRSLATYLRRLGQRVQAQRKNRGMSQAQLSEAAGLDRTYISTLEHGKQNVSIGAVMKLADALDVPISALLGDD